MKIILVSALTFILQTSLFAQHAPPPDYLSTQNFPDSVLQLPLTSLAGSSTTFGEILKRHEGKDLLIDFWASWCRDCLVSVPELHELMEHHPEMDFVFISLDKEEGKWTSSIDKYELNGDNYWLHQGWKNTLTSYINLDWIPRYIIIGADGQVKLPKAIKINEPEILKALGE
ncbi:TlpA family protein disulfide reductase [Fulvivirga ligni]|uniref:TlpA family protein disulfide reductase n=1 Tax=Fulvivirga ligni TaxID=2904246 RepID=UPI001F42A1B8|nr:thioredoxin family protein [Fulvivirga ligni]UII23996.1 thioredoxin family protein [Fulvivirga ligni]